MEWITRLNDAINYIEDHLSEQIDYGEVAKVASCSAYHFQRMFGYMADVPLAEYIRRRRMSRAAVELQNSTEKVIDIALKYGYDSPTAFNRAFQSIHGIAPSLVKKDAFRIIGVSEPLYHEIEKNFEIVPQMWQKVSMDGTIPKLAGMMDGQLMGMLGVSACNGEDDWKYFIAVASNQPIDGTLEEYIIPAAEWAVFGGEGIGQSIQELERRVVTEWLPTSGYEYADAPDIEVYLSPDPQNAKYEVWIPVVKK